MPLNFRIHQQNLSEVDGTYHRGHMRECYTFLDNINAPGKDFVEGLIRLRHTVEKLRYHDLKLNAEN